MQYGNLTKCTRKNGSAVWSFRWREAGENGKPVRRRLIIGTTKEFHNRSSARKALSGLLREINCPDRRLNKVPITFGELTGHYRQHELAQDNGWKAYSTRYAYEGYLKRWILPRWGGYSLADIRPVEMASCCGTWDAHAAPA